MGREPKFFKNSRRMALYLLGAACLVAGATILGLGILRAEDSPVRGTISPVLAQAPVPVDESVAERIEQARKEAAEKAAAEKAAAEKAAKEKAAAEKAAKEKAAKEKAAEEKAEKEKQQAQEEPPPERPVQAVAPEPEPTPPPAAAPSDTTLYLTVPKMGRYNDPVVNSIDPAVLDQGAGKLPSSGFPWQPGANTYIAGHVYGYEGTGSWQQFAGLPNMTYGDEIILTDANGTTYTYVVTEVMTVSPYDTWVTAPTGTTSVTLQTCTGPGWSQRLIVRGELVS